MSYGFVGRTKVITLTAEPQVIAEYNLQRQGLFIYNEAGVACKVAFGVSPEAGDYISLGAGKKIELDCLSPTGPVWASGGGNLIVLDNPEEDSIVGWSPSDLLPEFTDGKALWYDLSDASTIFADTASTIPATIGGPIGLIRDKSGNGMNLTFVGGDQPIWDGKSAVFSADAKFVLPGFLEASWAYNQSAGTTYYAVGFAPVAGSAGNRQVFQMGSRMSGDAGITLSYDNSPALGWKSSFNATEASFPATEQKRMISSRADFTDALVGEVEVLENKVSLAKGAFSSAYVVDDPLYHTSFFAAGDAFSNYFRGSFSGLFIRHVDTLADSDFEKLQKWMATKLQIEV